MSQESGKIITAIAESEEYPIFEVELVKDLVDFKWKQFAQMSHFIGAYFHLLNVISMIYYINRVYGKDVAKDAKTHEYTGTSEPNIPGLIGMTIGFTYALYHDGFQLCKQGTDYLKDKWNYIDMAYIFLGFYNIYRQYHGHTLDVQTKIVFITLVFLVLLKTFFFLRIIMSFSYIVTMIVNVVADLRVFLTFFAILILMFSAVFDIIAKASEDEYKKINPFFGNLFLTLRLSLNDFSFDLLTDKDSVLTPLQHWLFWIIWILMVLFSSLIFLNFIIAEVSNSYQTVKDQIDALIYKERAGLIDEVENITTDYNLKNNKYRFPKYIVIREMED